MYWVDVEGGAQQKTPDPRQPENTMSVGTLLTYGKFRFLNLGDLTWDRELMLACPVNKIGTVSLFQATHHGFFNLWSGAPPLVWAIKPQVVIVANGPGAHLAIEVKSSSVTHTVVARKIEEWLTGEAIEKRRPRELLDA
jgi:beta-lactamase superfamily II metal-dependent hydrolase